MSAPVYAHQHTLHYRWRGYLDVLPEEFKAMPMCWEQEDLQPLRNTSMAEKLLGKWPMPGLFVEPPTQVQHCNDTHTLRQL